MPISIADIKQGTIVRAPFWNEPVEIDLIEKVDNFIRIIGVKTRSNSPVRECITLEQFQQIEVITKEFFTQEAWKAFLAIETIRYRFASLYDPILAVNVSKIDPLPHQIEAVYGYILPLPKIRFLIADDPGAGKTIMAGLVIKELKLRHLIKRILIVVPGHLQDQWKRELKEKFEEDFELVNRQQFDDAYRVNIWEKKNQIITSMDFAKQSEILPTLSGIHFDLIIVDEAHKMSAYRYGDKVNKTERYKLGEVLSRASDHLLFITATPHKGDPENFRLFLDLLYPGFFATDEMIEESVNNRNSPLFIRRLKEDLKNFEGKPLFLPRYVETVRFDLGKESPEEKELYNELSKYIVTQYGAVSPTSNERRRNIAFALVILQRRFASSTYALLKSLERRKAKLEEVLQNFRERNDLYAEKIKTIDLEDLDEIEDLAEVDRWEKETEWETLSFARNENELNEEIQTIKSLISKAENIIKEEKEIKLRKLKETLETLMSKTTDPTKQKILIFTEAKDTLDYLERKIREWGYSVNTIHGGMRLEERVKAESVFKNETQIMVATEAAGEGINLQFCNLMINYDIPWTPIRLEQRMGRIHRYGQVREAYIYNFVATDTREGEILYKLLEKLNKIKEKLGSDKVYDVIGNIIQSREFVQVMAEVALTARSRDGVLNEIKEEDSEYIQKIKEKLLNEPLATKYIDYTRVKEITYRAKENRLIPEYTQSFFIRAFEKAGGEVKKLSKTSYSSESLYSIESVPNEIKRIADDESFKKLYGDILRRYPKVTFDKEISMKNPAIEFISFGHPLFEAVLKWVENNFLDSIYSGATFYDPDGKLDGYILFFEGEVKDGTGKVAGKRLFSFYQENRSNRIIQISPAIIWDLVEENNPIAENIPQIEKIRDRLFTESLNALEAYKKELMSERVRQAEIKEKYGIESLKRLIKELDFELLDLQERQKKGEPVDLVIWNKEKRKREYEQSLKELKELITKELNLVSCIPKFLGIIKVKPLPISITVSDKTNEKKMVSDAEVENIGMQIAMKYEQKEGRSPEDVSSLNLGFDIRSTDASGQIRYIEVKARAEIGEIAFTQNEWFKANRFADEYYLYVVYNAITEPKLIIIQNPAKNLKSEEKIELVRYLIDKDEILNKGIEIKQYAG